MNMLPALPGTALRRVFLVLMLTLLLSGAYAQRLEVPAVHHNIERKAGNRLVVKTDQIELEEAEAGAPLTLSAMQGSITGTETGLDFDFGLPSLNGTLFFGFIPYGDSKHPMPVYFKNPSPIVEGKATITIAGALDGRYDMVDWQENGIGTFGYRIMTNQGDLLYDGKVTFTGTGPFEVAPTVIEGPFVTMVGPDSAIIRFTTNMPVEASIFAAGQTFQDAGATTLHEIKLTGLAPYTEYAYRLQVGEWASSYAFRTAPPRGSQQPFTFAYASDSRNGQGGGERNLFGANFYIVKKIMALAKQQDIAYFQFSGDLINGYLNDTREMDLQYANWKRAIEPFSHYFPVYVSMGNHEALMRSLTNDEGAYVTVDRFPYETESAEFVFANNFTQPTNGPASEDGQEYDPDPENMDFPSYSENVFWYQHGNVATLVLNSNYWYAPNHRAIPLVSGNPHAYLMDGQIAWLKETLAWMETDSTIDHVFVTQHTPAFPNGGHVGDDMWYRGDNNVRAWVAGKPLKEGIIQRRDTYLNLLINESSKVRAILTGDEHNYARTEVGPETPIYPEDWALPRLELQRTIWQVNNGAAGAPYYAQEQTPWSGMVQGFTTQNALVLFYVDGSSIRAKVLNPDTLEEVDEFKLQ